MNKLKVLVHKSAKPRELLGVRKLNRSDSGPNNFVSQEQQDSQDSLTTLVEISEHECQVKSG
jgi:hypothetical protein